MRLVFLLAIEAGVGSGIGVGADTVFDRLERKYRNVVDAV